MLYTVQNIYHDLKLQGTQLLHIGVACISNSHLLRCPMYFPKYDDVAPVSAVFAAPPIVSKTAFGLVRNSRPRSIAFSAILPKVLAKKVIGISFSILARSV